MELFVKDINFLLDIDPYCSSSNLINAKIYITENILQDILAIKNNSLHFSSIDILENKFKQNSINGHNPMDYFLKGNLPYHGHHLDQISDCKIPFEINNNFIYVEDFQDLETLESLALIYDATIFSNKSFKRRSKNVFVYKSYLNLVEKITLLKKSAYYVGLDCSELAPIAKKILMNNTNIYKTNKLKDEELMFRFINEDNINFFKI